MRIGIDARFFGSIGKGLGRYTQKLIEHLERIDHENQYVVFLRKENFEEYIPQNPNFQKVLADYAWYTFAEQWGMPRLLRKYKLDLVHFPHFNVPLLYFGRFVITIHDLILLHFPTVRASTLGPFKYWLKFLAYRLVIFSAIKRAKSIIAVSNFTKSDILEHYGISSKKVDVTYEACEKQTEKPLTDGKKILAKYGIIKPYLLYVGNVYPHKNPERLIQALNLLKENNLELKLVFVGGDDYFYIRLKEFVRKAGADNVLFAGFVPDEDLDVLFSESLAYARPSLYEGFELPPLEAMSKGVPVISSYHECALEILGDSAAYFDPENVEDIANVIKKVFQDENMRKTMIEKGYKCAGKYDWQDMAEKTLQIYRKEINKKIKNAQTILQ